MVSRLKPQFNEHCIRIWSILKTALLATAATAASSLPRAVPLMHTQGNFNHLLIKVATEGSSRGIQIPYIQSLISMEPCTLWGKFLVSGREEHSFSGPQARACREQQPGALNSRWALQPLLTTGLEKEAAFQSGIQIASASWIPFDEVAFTEDMMFSAAWSVQKRTPPRRQRRACTQILQEIYRRSQPLMEQLKMSAVPHQHYLGGTSVALVINIMYSIKWQDNMLSTRLLQGHNLVSTIEAIGVLEKFQEEKPPTTRGEPLVSNHRQDLIEDFRRPRWTARRLSVPELPGEASQGMVHADATV